MKSYSLIKHDALGYGIVLRKDDDGVGTVGFEGNKGKRNILLTHPSVHPSDLTIRQFAQKKLYEYLFDDSTKFRGRSYANNTCILELNVRDKAYTGVVKGTFDYPFTIRIDDNSNIVFHCSCPVNDMCKHLYAALVFLASREEETNNPSFNRTTSEMGVKVLGNSNLLRKPIESFFFNKDEFTIGAIMSILSITKEHDLLSELTRELLMYYNRPQFKRRVCYELIPILLYDKRFQERIIQEKPESLSAREMYDTAITVFNNEYTHFSRMNVEVKKRQLADIVINEKFDDFVKIIDEDTSYIYRSLIAEAFIEYVKHYPLSIEQVIQLRKVYAFDSFAYLVNPRIANIVACSPAMLYALFIDKTRYNERFADSLSDIEIVKLGESVGMCSNYYHLLSKRIRTIGPNFHTQITDNLIRASINYGISDSEDYQHISNVLSAIPDTKYVRMIVDAHYHQKKRRYYW